MVKHVISMVLVVFFILTNGIARADDEHSMTKEQLLPILAKSDVIVIDVRSSHDWDNSKMKLPMARREDPMKFASWMKKYPKDKTIVLYCA